MPRPPGTQPPDSFAHFGELLRYLRQRARLTQRELSIAVGYSESHISRLEQGQRPPDSATLRARFLPALDIDAPALAERLVALGELARELPDLAPAEPSGGAATAVVEQPPPLPPGLLATKLFAPQLRHGVLQRPHLAARLEGALELPLTIVAAPAGSGKSSLVAAWHAGLAERDATPVGRGWLALDPADNDPQTFARYLVATLQQAAPIVARVMPEPLPAYELTPAAVLTPVVNALAGLAHPAVLILDDYHVISAPAAHALLAFLLDHAPPQLHLVLLTREDPPLALARMRARRQLLELRATDLRLTIEETATFLQQVMAVAASADEVASLWAATEGWAAGVQLAALAMRNHADRGQLLVALSGTNRYLVDYLASEVLDQLPPHLRSFVLQTAILDRMCAPLCDALLGLGESDGSAAYSQRILEELERLHLFIVPLDAERRWYRYHHLFADFLRARLRDGTGASGVAALHGRAGEWFERHDLVAEAITHATGAEDWERVAALVERESQVFFDLAGLHFWVSVDWITAIPEAIRRRQPMLCLIQSWSLRTSDPGASVRWLDYAEQAARGWADSEVRQHMLAEIAATRSTTAILRGDSGAAQEAARQALVLLPPGHARTRVLVLRNLERALFQEGQQAQAEAMIAEAVAVAREAGLTQTLQYLIAFHGFLQRAYGQIDRALDTYRRGLGQRQSSGVQVVAERASVLVGLADLELERNQLGEAEATIHEALSAGAELTNVLPFALLVLARLQAARGDVAGALTTLRDKAPFKISELTSILLPAVQALEAQLWLRQGKLAAAELWAQTAHERWHPLYENTPPIAVYAHEHLAVAPIQIALARGRHDGEPASLTRALRLIEVKLGERSAQAAPWLSAKLHLLRGLTLDLLGERAGALDALAQSLSAAEPARYLRLFLDEGASALALLRAYELERGGSAYVAALLAAAPST